MQNKPNFRSGGRPADALLCKTKPILGLRIMPNKTPTTKVPESDSDLRFWVDTKDRFG